MATTTAADRLIDVLADWGVDVIFGLPGDGINGIMEALRKRQDSIRFIQVRHEEAAAFMACGYAKFTAKIGVCLATSGPGGLHLLNGLYDAKLDGQPVLAITGLPYGRQRLVELAIALGQKPEVLLLDEPAAGVPSAESHIILDAIDALPKSIGVLIIDHDMDLVFRFAQRITVLVRGAIFAEGTPKEIGANSDVRAVYAGRVEFHDGDRELAPGLSLHKIGGHTMGMQSVRVHTKRGWVVLASDASHMYANMEEGRPFPIVHDMTETLEGYRTLRRLAASPRHIIPGHDPLVMARYPAASPKLEGIVARLDADPRDV